MNAPETVVNPDATAIAATLASLRAARVTLGPTKSTADRINAFHKVDEAIRLLEGEVSA